MDTESTLPGITLPDFSTIVVKGNCALFTQRKNVELALETAELVLEMNAVGFKLFHRMESNRDFWMVFYKEEMK